MAATDEMKLSADDAEVEADKPLWMSLDYTKEVPYTRLMRYTFVRKNDSCAKKEGVESGGSDWEFVKSETISQFCIEFPFVNPSVSCKKVL